MYWICLCLQTNVSGGLAQRFFQERLLGLEITVASHSQSRPVGQIPTGTVSDQPVLKHEWFLMLYPASMVPVVACLNYQSGNACINISAEAWGCLKTPEREIVYWRKQERLLEVFLEWEQVIRHPCISTSHLPRKILFLLASGGLFIRHSYPLSGTQNWEIGFGRIPFSHVLLYLSSLVWAYKISRDNVKWQTS